MKTMNILSSVDSIFVRLRRLIVCIVVFLVIAVSLGWLWRMDNVLNEQMAWCDKQKDAMPLNVCGGIAERDIERTYYLKVLMMSVLVFGSTGLLLMITNKERS